MAAPFARPTRTTHGADQVLGLLYDRGEGFFGLDELARAAGASGQRLEQTLAALRQAGQQLEVSPAHGVRLGHPVTLNAHLIERNLGTTRIGLSVICFNEVDSTNDVAMDSARQGDTDGLAVLAESQRSGRGRHGRVWISPPRANVLLSVLLLEDPVRPPSHEALTIASGLAVAEGVEGTCGLACRLKWPNDVLLDGRKTAGVLVETRRLADRLAVVIGIGINANASPLSDRVDAPATDLAAQVGHPIERIEVIRGVLRKLDDWVRKIRGGATSGLHDAWLARCGMINERVTVQCGRERYVGRVLDIRPLSGLVLCCDDGRTVHLPAEKSSIVT